MTGPMSLDDALALLGGTGRIRLARIPCERQAVDVVRAELNRLRDALPEATCPNCDATIRARLADQPDHEQKAS